MPSGTLRMWESRHDFPTPSRLPGGHRRYSLRDVEQVREVARLRERGLSMSAAITQVRQSAEPMPSSVFAGLRKRHAGLFPVVVSKRALLRMTRALEDEYCARATDGLILGSFQKERFYRSTERRWAELGRTAALTVALADFPELRETPTAVEVPIARDEALTREWTLIVDASGAQACLSAWEHPSPCERPDFSRRFEVLWSCDPAVVRSASEVAAELLRRTAPEVAADIRGALSHPVSPTGPEFGFASALAHRMVGYLAQSLDRRAGGDKALYE